MKSLGFFTYVSESANDKQLHVWTIFCMKCFIWYLRVRFFRKYNLVNPFSSYLGCFQASYSLKNVCFQKFSSRARQIKNTQAKDPISIGSRNFKKGFMHKSAFSWLNSTLVSTQFVKHGKRLNIQSFSRKKFLLQKCMLNKCDRPKLICFIIKCYYNA